MQQSDSIGLGRRKWYEKYLPEKPDIKKLNSEQEEKLLSIFHDCEKEADIYLEKIVKEHFFEQLKDIGYKNLNSCMPEGVYWDSLTEDKKTDLIQIYNESIAKQRSKKKIKVNFKKYLSEGKPLVTIETKIKEKPKEETDNPKEEKVYEWIENKLKEKGYVSKSEDFENFKKLLGYSSRSFSNKMKEAGLTFVNKKWIKS